MKNKVSKMREAALKKYLQDNANNWKDIHKKNCLAVTTMYESEQTNLE